MRTPADAVDLGERFRCLDTFQFARRAGVPKLFALVIPVDAQDLNKFRRRAAEHTFESSIKMARRHTRLSRQRTD